MTRVDSYPNLEHAVLVLKEDALRKIDRLKEDMETAKVPYLS